MPTNEGTALAPVTAPVAATAAAGTPVIRGVKALVVVIADLVMTWHERHCQRRHLSGLDDRLLKDIGLSRADIESEVRKPFWRG